MKILQIITGLGNGGAENTLYKICKYDKLNEHIVISLLGPGKYFSLLKALGVKVYCLNINFISIHKFFFLVKLIHSLKPDIVQTWLVHADFLGGISARLAGIKNVIWNIRYSNLEIGKTKLSTIIIIKLLAKLSYFVPKSIIVVSKKAKKIYEKKGYDSKKFKFIPNGYDLSILKPINIQKQNLKKKIKLKKNIPLIGNVARYNPKKDHSNLLIALSIIKSKKIDFFCILVGPNINRENKGLTSEIKRLKLSRSVKLLGQNQNISQIMNGIDVYVQSSSGGEGFPNVVAESMACGTPCVVTDVGDAAFIADNTGWVVPPKNPIKLANAIKHSLDIFCTKNWKIKQYKSRLRIKKKFNLEKMLNSYNKVWIKVYKNINTKI